jgi:hypothetical protein
MMSRKLFGALGVIGGAVLFANPAAAQLTASIGDVQLMGAGCPARDQVSVQVSNAPAAAVTASTFTISFTGADGMGPGIRATGADVVSECAIAIRVSTTATREAKFTLRDVMLDVTSNNDGTVGTQSVTSTVRLGRAQTRATTTDIPTLTDPAMAATPRSITISNAALTSDVTTQGGTLLVNLSLTNAGAPATADNGVSEAAITFNIMNDVAG